MGLFPGLVSRHSGKWAGIEAQNIPQQHPNSQWLGFDALIMCEKHSLSTLFQDLSVASALFKRTSKVELTLLKRVKVGEGIFDEVGGEPHIVERPLPAVGEVDRRRRAEGRKSAWWGAVSEGVVC